MLNKTSEVIELNDVTPHGDAFDDITIVSGGEIVDLDADDDDLDVSEDAEEEAEGDEPEAEASEPEAEVAEEAAEEEETSEGAEPPAEGDSAEAPAEPEAATAPVEDATAAAPEPLRLKADGTEFEVPARKDAEGNYVITPEDFQRTIQPRLADRGAWARERQSYQSQIAALDPNKNPEVIRARETMAAFQALMDQGPDKVIEWAENYEANKEVLIARAEAAAARAEAQAVRGVMSSREQETQVAQLEEQLEQGIDVILERAKALPDYSSIDAEYVKKVLMPMRGSIFYRAQRDMPEQGLRAGDIGVRYDVIEPILQAEQARNARSEAERQRQEAARRNAAALAPTKAKPAPTGISASKATSTDGGPAAPKLKSKEDWEDHLAAIAAGRA